MIHQFYFDRQPQKTAVPPSVHGIFIGVLLRHEVLYEKVYL